MQNNKPVSEETQRIQRLREHIEQQERAKTENRVTRSSVSLADILGGGFKLGGATS